MSRQQRTQNNRGQQPVATLAFVRPVEWTIAEVIGVTIKLSFVEPTGEPFINGLPRFLLEPAGEYCLTATVVGSQVWLQFPSNITDSQTLSIGAKDPAVRFPSGAYLAPGSAEYVILPPPDVAFINASSTLTSAVSVMANDGGGTVLFPSLSAPEWRTLINPGAGADPVVVGSFTVGPQSVGKFKWDGSVWIED